MKQEKTSFLIVKYLRKWLADTKAQSASHSPIFCDPLNKYGEKARFFFANPSAFVASLVIGVNTTLWFAALSIDTDNIGPLTCCRRIGDRKIILISFSIFYLFVSTSL